MEKVEVFILVLGLVLLGSSQSLVVVDEALENEVAEGAVLIDVKKDEVEEVLVVEEDVLER